MKRKHEGSKDWRVKLTNVVGAIKHKHNVSNCTKLPSKFEIRKKVFMASKSI